MLTACTEETAELFTPDIADQFGGHKELLSCLESLSRKLHRLFEDAEENVTGANTPN